LNFVLVGEGFPAAKALETILADSRARVRGVFTGMEDPRRLRALTAAAAIPLLDAATLRTEAASRTLSELEPDWLINANSTVIIHKAPLSIPRQGCLNLHPGLLPEYAGLHTHQWAIRNGEAEFGATIHFIAPELDAGDIARVARFPIKESDTGLSLFQRCIGAGVDALNEVVRDILDGRAVARTPQDLSRRHVYRHRDALDGRVDWRMPARAVVDFARAGNYEPFQSPTYTAELDAPPGAQAPRLLAARVAGPSARPAGAVADGDEHPLVACGDGVDVALTKAVWNGRRMARADWDAYFAAFPAKVQKGKNANRGD
jgi:UDP-4-amino-4-deoxy-L-arabinose formyltransferase/UDP-glucuronic acid dehydrogenase (UDP-4-keto-hexauronic acid decarboxylating)